MNYPQLTLNEHYEQMLNLSDPWTVSGLELDTENLRLKINVSTAKGTKLPCPTCGKSCSKEDHREERAWRHLDTMQFETTIICRVPRINCPEHGILSAEVPWADGYSRFTELFEKFAIDVLKVAKNVKSATGLLRLSWYQIHDIQARAVERGLLRRQDETIKHLGIDEKNFHKGHSYVSLLNDLDNVRVLEVVPDRTEEAATTLLNTLTDKQKQNVEATAMDMWPAFMNASHSILPQSDVVHDKYHVATYLGKAVDLVRRQENKTFVKDGNNVLKGTKYLWLTNPDNWDLDDKKEFRSIASDEMKVGRAWSIKESFRHFWDYRYRGVAEGFFKWWYYWATHSKLKPIIEAAKTLKRHVVGIFAYLKHHITNAATEGLNSKIQSIKSDARGFRSFQNYRIAILFHCGKLDLYP
ncbi:MAG: ISL3 family transposase [Candidatus Uhrbacteria bacterium]